MCSFYKQGIKNGLNLKEDYRVFNDVKDNEEEYLTDVLKEKIIM